MGAFEQSVLTETIRQLRQADRLWQPGASGVGYAREAVPVRWWTEGHAICIVYEQPPFAGLRGVRWVLDPDSERDVDALYAGREATASVAPEWAGMFVQGELTDVFPTPSTSEEVDRGAIAWWRDVGAGLPDRLAPDHDAPEPGAVVLAETVRQLRRAGRVWELDKFPAYHTSGRAVVPVSWWTEQGAVCIVYEQLPVAGLHGVRHAVGEPAGAIVADLLAAPPRPNSRAATDRGEIAWSRDVRAGLPASLPADREYPIG